MIEILEKMYRGYGFGTGGISYFNKFIDELKKYNFSEILAFQARRYHLKYVMAFLLSTPSLWIHFSDVEWIEIMRSMNPRPYPITIDLDKGDFVDIHFLVKYIRVNSIEAFLHQESFSNLDKNHVIKYCLRDVHSLFSDEIDLEDLDGHTFVNEQEIRNLQDKLTSGRIFNNFNFSEDDDDEVRSYLKTEQIFLDLLQQGVAITVTNFALSTRIFREEAQEFLDQKAKLLNGNIEAGDAGEIIYRFSRTSINNSNKNPHN